MTREKLAKVMYDEVYQQKLKRPDGPYVGKNWEEWGWVTIDGDVDFYALADAVLKAMEKKQ